jgi:O-antigen ligase
MYNPILAFGAYLLAHAVFFEKLTNAKRLLHIVFLLTISINMLISGGRSGQAGFIAMVGVLVFQRYARRPLVAALVAIFVGVFIFVAAYHSSDLFKQRADLAYHEIVNFNETVNTSVGARINFAINTIRMIIQSPFLGVGVGDYPAEYARINAQYTPKWVNTVNPHNQFLFDMSTMGILGGASLVTLLFAPVFYAKSGDEEKYKTIMALLILFLVICLGESYLWRSNTGLMFVAFNAILCSSSIKCRCS